MKKNKIALYAAIALIGLSNVAQPLEVNAQTYKVESVKTVKDKVVDQTKKEWENTLDAIEYFKQVYQYGIPDEPIEIVRNMEVDESLKQDEAALDYFNKQDKMQKEFTNKPLKKSKVNYSAIAKSKTIFTEGVDFIYYNCELKVYGKDKDGIFYDDLKPETQKEIFDIVNRNREYLVVNDKVSYDKLDDCYKEAGKNMSEAKEYSDIVKQSKEEQAKENTQKEETESKSFGEVFKDSAKREIETTKDAYKYFADLFGKSNKKGR